MTRAAAASRGATGTVAVLAAIIGLAAPATAQDAGEELPRMLLLGVHYGAPERLSGTLSGVFPYGTPRREGGSLIGHALEVRGRVGLGDYGVSIGPRILYYGSFGPEAMLTVRRTFASPRAAHRRSTYVGVEVGYQLLAYVSVGVARQVDGPSHRRDTRLTWNVGVQIPYGIWSW